MDQTDPRIHVTLDHLRSLQGGARGLSFLPRQNSASVLNGRHSSRLRGRGLNFEEMRDYLPGDDIRSIDWKATARTGSPHVRVFTEERDRPVLLVVDQRMSMFFGTTERMKSVTAAEAAAITAFRVRSQGDRIGGIVFGDDELWTVEPRSSARALNTLMHNIVAANQSLESGRAVPANRGWFNEVLAKVVGVAHHDHLVVIFSDFAGLDDISEKRLGNLSAHNDVILVLVHDRAAAEFAADERLIISDGGMQAELQAQTRHIKEAVQSFSRDRLERIYALQGKVNLSVLPLESTQDTLAQMRRLMGAAQSARRVR